MKWYIAHIIMLIKFQDSNQDRFPVWENMVLLQASSEDEALDKARKIGIKNQSVTNSDFTWDNMPAYFVFAGVRKLIDCINPEQCPNDGTEVSYSQFEVDSEESLNQLVSGESVFVQYVE